jgi:signal transduction histidine kinase
MMHKEQWKDNCALCGKLIGTEVSDAYNTYTVEETIQNTHYKFDTRECATMFKRFIDVYGKDFQPLLGDKQYISDPFWDRVLPKEDEIKVIRAQEKDNIDTERSNVRDKRSGVVTIIRDSFEVQKMLKELVQSAKENVSLAIPTTATDLFFSSRQPQEVSSSPSDYSLSFSCSVFFQQIKNIAADNKNLTVKILTYPDRWPRESEEEDDSNTSSSVREDWEGQKPSNIQVKYMERDYSSLNEDIVILVVDRRASLAIELDEKEKRQKGSEEAGLRENHRKDALYRMIKLATYSENKSTVLSYISIFESLWKEIELNEKITSLLAEIKRRENIERDFINMAAHELRAPIQPVLGLAQILQTKKNVDSKEQEELLSVIIRNARRLNILTENLLDLAKIESNTLNLQKETFSLTELIFEAIADMKSQLSTNEVMVNVEYNDGSAARHRYNHKNDDDKLTSKVLNPDDNSPLVLVEADKIRIMQVISNLLTNAIKFTRGGKVAIIIDNNNGTRKEKGEGDVVVSFRDNGTGIDPEIIDKVFEKFVTKSDKGTGLGLFISRKIIEAHGGSIRAKNNTNAEGATIAFSLPIAVSS